MMKAMEISYQDLRGVDPTHVEKLKRREEVIRQAIDEMGRSDTSVRWSYVDDGSRNYVFRLVASADQNDCIVQVSPLDLTLEPEQFEQMLAEGKRSCGDASP